MQCSGCGSYLTRMIGAGVVIDTWRCEDCRCICRMLNGNLRGWVVSLLLVLLTGNPLLGVLGLSLAARGVGRPVGRARSRPSSQKGLRSARALSGGRR